MYHGGNMESVAAGGQLGLGKRRVEQHKVLEDIAGLRGRRVEHVANGHVKRGPALEIVLCQCLLLQIVGGR